MTVKTYSAAKDGNTKLSKNFTVKEFRCNDGSDKILIDSDLVSYLQKIRDHFGKSVHVISGYRTLAYNSAVGGTSSSYHVKGQAADIQINGVNPAIVAMYAETIGAGGIGLYSYVSGGFVHVDSRAIKYRWLQITNNTRYQQVNKMLPTLKQGSSNVENAVKLLQRKLGVNQSGTFGDYTSKAVRAFQTNNGLTVDGIVGLKTWSKLFS